MDKNQFIPSKSILDENIRSKTCEVDVSYESYGFLYDTIDGDGTRTFSQILLAPRFLGLDVENHFDPVESDDMTTNPDDEGDDIVEI